MRYNESGIQVNQEIKEGEVIPNGWSFCRTVREPWVEFVSIYNRDDAADTLDIIRYQVLGFNCKPIVSVEIVRPK